MSRLKNILLITLAILAVTRKTTAQEKTLSPQQVMEVVRQFHPVAKQASIVIDKAKADITIARGNFDPLLNNSIAQKTFDGTAYYQYKRPELNIPTWFGIELTAGLENLSGNRTDPTETLGKTSYMGISIPLAQNLLMDKRRAVLQTAKILRQASETERKNILNNLLLDAMKAYWYWVQYYQAYKVLTDAVLVNEKRLDLVKTGFRLGDRPAIDTVEALTQLQSFSVQRENAYLQFQNAGLELSVFLWNADDKPVDLPVEVTPAEDALILTRSPANLPVLNELIDAARKNHPELILYNFKLDVLFVDRKLKFQQLLPVANFKYNHLNKGYDILKSSLGPLFENNFQYGLTLGIPLRLSEGRGEYRKAKLKIAETKLQQDLKALQIENKIRSYFNEMTALKKQIEIQEKAYQNYLALQRGEEIRFLAGESSLFLINARENKTLEALQKLQELRTKYLVTANELQWAAGVLTQQ